MKRAIVFFVVMVVIGAALLLALLDSAYGAPVRLLGFDASTSVAKYGPLMRRDGKDALAAIPDGSRVVVFEFTDHVQVAFDGTILPGNRPQAEAAIDSIRAGKGPTDLNAPARFASTFAPTVQLVLFSDMEQSAGKTKFDAMLINNLPSVVRKYGDGLCNLSPTIPILTGKVIDWRRVLHTLPTPPASPKTAREPLRQSTPFWIFASIVTALILSGGAIVGVAAYRRRDDQKKMMGTLAPLTPPAQEQPPDGPIPTSRYRIKVDDEEGFLEQGAACFVGEAWDAAPFFSCGTAIKLTYGPDETLEVENRGPGVLEIGAYVLKAGARRRIRDAEFLEMRAGAEEWTVAREAQPSKEGVTNE